jgi:hypothetical protein
MSAGVKRHRADVAFVVHRDWCDAAVFEDGRFVSAMRSSRVLGTGSPGSEVRLARRRVWAASIPDPGWERVSGGGYGG